MDNSLLQNVLDAMPGLIFWKSNDLRYLGANRKFIELIGLESLAQLIGKRDNELLWKKECATYFSKHDQDVISLKKTYFSIQKKITMPDNISKTITTDKYPILNHDNQAIGILGISSDSYDQNLSNQTYLDTIIGRIPYYIFWKNTESVYLGCNQMFAELVGEKSPADIIGKSDFDLKWGNGEPEFFIQGDKQTMAGHHKVNAEEALVRQDGSEMVMLVSKIPLLDNGGNCVGVLGISTDITDRKKMEEQLKISKEMAETANKAKSEFIANMSHDVKTPLSGVIGMADLLAHQLTEKNELEFAQCILTASKQLMNFFDNCVEMLKSDGGDITFLSELFNLKSLIAEISGLFQPTIKTKRLDFIVDLVDPIPDLLIGSRSGIYRILINLLSNAIKFTDTGFIKISIKYNKPSFADKLAIIKIVIEDTGIGIPSDKQGIIFERFTRLVPSYKGVYEGSGIGLYIVKKFVKALQGEIYVKSEEGKGSRFTVILPLEIPLLGAKEYAEDQSNMLLSTKINACSVVNPPVIDEPAVKESNFSTCEKLPTILLVEDNLIAQKVAQSVLAPFSHRVEVADTGEKALAQFEPGKYDLVFMDIGLPDITGDTVSKCFRALENGKSDPVPIIALTAHANDAMKSEYLSMGIQAVLNKPLSIEQARQVIEQYGSPKLAKK